VSGDSASGGPEGEGVAGGVADGAASESDARAFNWQSGGDARGLDLTDEPSALTTQQTPAVLLTMREGAPGGGKGPLLVEEESLTLATGNGQTLFQPQAFDEMNFTTDPDTHHVLRAGTPQSTGVLQEHTTHAIVEPWGFSAGNTEHARSMGEEQGVAPPIRAGASGTNQSPTVGPVDYGVRRLTPVECERLQAFPDGWTEPAGSDSARYKALGNAVTVNTVRWVLGRMLEQS
jgi:site-specific DNA-cytosine methylase